MAKGARRRLQNHPENTMLCSYDFQKLILPNEKGHSCGTAYPEDNLELEKA